MKALASIDLNLLVALDALLGELSVTRAGQRIGLSQPAMSHALARLRDLLDDELLVRSPEGMRPTERAKELAPRVRSLLETIQRDLLTAGEFDPAADDRRFAVAASDYVGAVLLPELVGLLRERAPRVELRVRPLPPEVPVQALADGDLDLVVGTFRDVPAQVCHDELFREGFACVLPAGAGRRSLTAEELAAMDHVLVSSPSEGAGPVDAALAERGLTRRIAVYVPHFLTAPAVVARSADLVVTLPERIARAAAGRLPVAIVAPPFELPRFPVSMIWHTRTSRHPAHRWLRALVAEAAGLSAADATHRKEPPPP
jgi:DNA-binding transcriptional LysR family regulator